jgi:hypothetical protein
VCQICPSPATIWNNFIGKESLKNIIATKMKGNG